MNYVARWRCCLKVRDVKHENVMDICDVERWARSGNVLTWELNAPEIEVCSCGSTFRDALTKQPDLSVGKGE